MTFVWLRPGPPALPATAGSYSKVLEKSIVTTIAKRREQTFTPRSLRGGFDSMGTDQRRQRINQAAQRRLEQGHGPHVGVAHEEQKHERHGEIILRGEGINGGEEEVSGEAEFNDGNPAGAAPHVFLLLPSFFPGFQVVLWGAYKFSFLTDQCFHHRLAIVDGQTDARRHNERHVLYAAAPFSRIELALCHQVKTRNRTSGGQE